MIVIIGDNDDKWWMMIGSCMAWTMMDDCNGDFGGRTEGASSPSSVRFGDVYLAVFEFCGFFSFNWVVLRMAVLWRLFPVCYCWSFIYSNIISTHGLLHPNSTPSKNNVLFPLSFFPFVCCSCSFVRLFVCWLLGWFSFSIFFFFAFSRFFAPI